MFDDSKSRLGAQAPHVPTTPTTSASSLGALHQQATVDALNAKFDPIAVSRHTSRKDNRGQAVTITFERLAEGEECADKHAVDLILPGVFLPGKCRERGRTKWNLSHYSLILADYDDRTPGAMAGAYAYWVSLGYACVVYTSHSHTSEKEQFRIALRVSRPVQVHEWKPLLRKMAALAGEHAYNRETWSHGNLFYVHSWKPGAPHYSAYSPGKPVDVDAILSSQSFEELLAGGRDEEELEEFEPLEGDATADDLADGAKQLGEFLDCALGQIATGRYETDNWSRLLKICGLVKGGCIPMDTFTASLDTLADDGWYEKNVENALEKAEPYRKCAWRAAKLAEEARGFEGWRVPNTSLPEEAAGAPLPLGESPEDKAFMSDLKQRHASEREAARVAEAEGRKAPPAGTVERVAAAEQAVERLRKEIQTLEPQEQEAEERIRRTNEVRHLRKLAADALRFARALPAPTEAQLLADPAVAAAQALSTAAQEALKAAHQERETGSLSSLEGSLDELTEAATKAGEDVHAAKAAAALLGARGQAIREAEAGMSVAVEKEGEIALARTVRATLADLRDQLKAALREEKLAKREAKGGPVLRLNREDRPEPSFMNCCRVLTDDPRLAGRIWYNEFKGVVMLTEDDGKSSVPCTVTERRQLRAILGEQYDLHVSNETMRDGLEHVAQSDRRHPIRDYLNALKWDGVERLKSLARLGFCGDVGEEEAAYSGTLLTRWTMSAVARILYPGCQADSMIVLVGPQGLGKSSAVRALVGGNGWFNDNSISADEKRAIMEVPAFWVHEMAELAAMKTRDVETMKLFVTRRTDTGVVMHGQDVTTVPRHSVFFGTTNAPDFLVDPTGNRRFWAIRTVAIDLTWIAANRDQLWAEATRRVLAGEPWHLTAEESAAVAARNSAYEAEDLVAQAVAEKLAGSAQAVWRTRELVCALTLLPELDGRLNATSVGRALAKCGWVKRKTMGAVVWAWDSSDPGSVAPQGAKAVRPHPTDAELRAEADEALYRPTDGELRGEAGLVTDAELHAEADETFTVKR